MEKSQIKESNQPFDVHIKKITTSGIFVKFNDGSEGWLPADEWSYEQSAWDREKSNLATNDELRVIAWGKTLQEGKSALSRRRVERNPWDAVTEKLIGQPKQFIVTKLTQKYAIGEIEAGLQAMIQLAEFDSYLKERDPENLWRSRTWIGLGKWVGGVVYEKFMTQMNLMNQLFYSIQLDFLKE